MNGSPASLRTLAQLKGVGPGLSRKLESAGVRKPEDFVTLYPRAYKDWRTPASIAQIVAESLTRAGTPEADSTEYITVARVESVREVRARIAIVSAELESNGSRLRATWFGRRGLALHVGDRLFVHGRVTLKRKAGAMSLEMNVLHHRVLKEDEVFSGSIVPVYPATKDLPSSVIAALVKRNLDALAALVPDALPAPLLRRRGYGLRSAAWREAQFPASLESAEAARERLKYEEFFEIALAPAVKRARRASEGGATPMPAPAELMARFEASLPFALTGAQSRAIAGIWTGMGSQAPMNRMLQGDVGSGKTLVAAAAIVLAAANCRQSALMAPTEILAAQHAAKLAPLLLPFGVTVEALFGSMGLSQRRRANDRIRSGEAMLTVGTHALLTETVEFERLGLVIIDEQHRFGVLQRAALRAKSRAPHTLHMTATPIPRTLAQTRYADLDLTVLDELPPGRTPVETFVLRAARKGRVYELVRAVVERGQQAYVIAPSIGDGDADGGEVEIARAVEEFESLSAGVFSDLRLGLLHGRLTPKEKEMVMTAFSRGEIDVLVSTTVVEVGVDVPNATAMAVLDAHRYGLAQLHQLRGRVGRGAARSFCILVAPDDRPHIERLSLLEETNDGFAIAEHDLRLRGGGEFAGTAQAGLGGGTLGDVQKDFALYMEAKMDADELVQSDPGLDSRENAGLRDQLRDDTFERAIAVSS